MTDMNVSFLSELDGYNKPRLEAYEKHLLLNSGRQIEEASDFTEIVDERTGFSGLDSTDSVSVNIFYIATRTD